MSEVCLESMLGQLLLFYANYVGCAAGVKKSECNYIANIKSAQWNLVQSLFFSFSFYFFCFRFCFCVTK